MRKLILKNHLCPGDVVTLTAAVRDLHRCYPRQFVTDVRTPFPAIWQHNPYITPLDEKAGGAELLECHYPLIHRSNTAPFHFVHGFTQFLNQQLGIHIEPSEFKGDIHISDEEKRWCSQVHELTGEDTPFWIINAGGKYDVTVKWWDTRRYQQVVDYFRGKIQFVQVGKLNDYHPKLRGVIDLRGRTDMRQLIRLVYESQGVLCGVTALMHMAAAIETKPGMPKNRPCVVVAGGREPAQWEAYPHHQYIHTNGALFCCDQGGCWKSRTVPIGDGDERDHSSELCVNVAGHLPRCMDMITTEEVIRRIEFYFNGGAIRYLTASEAYHAEKAVAKMDAAPDARKLTVVTARPAAEDFLATDLRPYPAKRFEGRGIVVPGGGPRYLPSAWVCINMLRNLGCTLPIQLWHLGANECDDKIRGLLAPLGVECVDARAVAKKHPVRSLNGWELKPFAILNSSFKEVLLLDADNVPVIDPTFLFQTPEYADSGAIFWPDYSRLRRDRPIWELCGVKYRNEPEFETGQIVVNKERCWNALQLTMWYNEHSDFFYRFIHGDKETFHMAWRKLEQPYAMPSKAIEPLAYTMCQHDFIGRRLFQHRNLDKWSLFGRNKTIGGFLFENECLELLAELRKRWTGRLNFNLEKKNTREQAAAKKLMTSTYRYRRIGYDDRYMTFKSTGFIGNGAAGCEVFWDVKQEKSDIVLEISSDTEITCRMRLNGDGTWHGRWERHERMPVELRPVTISGADRGRRVPATKNREIIFRGPINAHTGYGLHSCQIISDLYAAGYDVKARPTEILEEHAHLPEVVRSRLTNRPGKNAWELMLHPPNLPPTDGKRTVYFTMWEATRLPQEWSRWLNRAECLVVPCQWNATSFSASGVNVPIHVIPLGIKEDVFLPHPMDLDGPCVFGAAGKMGGGGGGKRKGLNEVIELFQEAFPRERDVRLKIKAFADCGVEQVEDQRVEITARFMSEVELASWYASLTCFVSMSRSEGWGLMPHQAMAVGRPCIAVRFGGHAEYMTEQNALCVRYDLVPAAFNYHGGGVWAEPDREHISEHMRWVYRNREAAKRLGERAAREVAPLTWKNSNEKLIEVLKEVGMIGNVPRAVFRLPERNSAVVVGARSL
jgi:glycosyltransferase involved in cell wall biosynthesis